MSDEKEDEIEKKEPPIEELAEEEKEPEGEPVEKIKEPEPDEVEVRAKRMGWAPKEQFRGDQNKWVDAKTFVERGETMLPILRERLNKQEEQNRELLETVQDFRKYMTKTEERAYERAKRELEEKRAEAKEKGDFDKFEQVTTEIHKLETEAKPKVPEKQEKPDPTKEPVFVAWQQENDWLTTDPERAVYAESYADFLTKTKPGLRGQEFLNEVSKAVKKEFPERFENPRRNGVARVEGGGGAPQKKTVGRSYNDLPPDARKECDRYVKQGLLKKEDYVKDYQWE